MVRDGGELRAGPARSDGRTLASVGRAIAGVGPVAVPWRGRYVTVAARSCLVDPGDA